MVRIDWHYPEPRTGWRGEWDRFMGPGMTAAELWLAWGVTLAAVTAVTLYAVLGSNWTWWQAAVVILMAGDLAGGVVVNAMSTAKRWYHRPGQRKWDHFKFVLVHLHPFVLALLFAEWDWLTALLVYSCLLLATAVILNIPLYLQRPTAVTLFAGVILLNLYLLPVIPGLEWFVPIFFLKLLISHVLREEPYRPEKEEI